MTSLPILQAASDAPEIGAIEAGLRALWPVAQRRLSTWRGLPKRLSLMRRFRLRMLRTDDLVVRVPQGLVPDCGACAEICCTGPNSVVTLRLLDLARFVDRGMERYIAHDRPQEKIAVSRETWARRTADATIFHRAFPVLLRDRTGTCALLTEDRLCGAHPSWPLSCARYPYALDLLGKTIFYAKGCGSRELLPYRDAAPRVQRLVDSVVEGYNERVKDVILVHAAPDELRELGLWQHLRIDGAR